MEEFEKKKYIFQTNRKIEAHNSKLKDEENNDKKEKYIKVG